MISDGSIFEKNSCYIRTLARKYEYDEWRVRISDIQLNSVHVCDLKRDDYATLIMQGNGFTFSAAQNCISTKLSLSPYMLKINQNSDFPKTAEICYEGKKVSELFNFKLLEIMHSAPLYYFPFKDENGLPDPVYLIVNPNEGCAYRCKSCSRIPFFGGSSTDYMHNLSWIVDSLEKEIKDKRTIKFINIITGSQKDSESDFRMFKDVINVFRDRGYDDVSFGIYSHQITNEDKMKRLKEAGVISFTATMEVCSDKKRIEIYGKRGKGRLKFKDFLLMLKLAEKYFLYTSISIILGHESSVGVRKHLTVLADETTSFVNHFIPRVFLPEQAKIIHPEAERRGLDYYLEVSAFIEKKINTDRMTFGRFFKDNFGIPMFGRRFRS